MDTVHNNCASIKRTPTHDQTNAQGFTLIELLVVIALLAVFPTVLIPAIQAAREARAHSDASANLNQLVVASREYRNRNGSYPARIDDLVGWNFTPLDPHVAQGKKSGYLYEIVESDQSRCRIEAKPEYPGITGSLCFGKVIEGYFNVQSYQIISAGADQAKEQMLNNIAAKAAETAAKLLRLDMSAASQVREHAQSPDAVGSAFNALDSNFDGGVSLNEMTVSPSIIQDTQLRGPLDEFLAYVAREMKLESLSEEEKSAVRVQAGSVPPSVEGSLFSYDRMHRLTRAWINQPDISNSLCASLDAAAAAEQSRNYRARNDSIWQYQALVRSQIGLSIAGSDAQSLITLTEVIIAR